MAKRLSTSKKIVVQYMKYSDSNFNARIQMMTQGKLTETLEAFEDECEYDYIYKILDEFKRRKG